MNAGHSRNLNMSRGLVFGSFHSYKNLSTARELGDTLNGERGWRWLEVAQFQGERRYTQRPLENVGGGGVMSLVDGMVLRVINGMERVLLDARRSNRQEE